MERIPHRGSSKTDLILLILAHTQFLIGGILYFVSPMSTSGLNNLGAAMKDPTLRLYTIEHPLIMIFAIVFITILFKSKKRHFKSSET